VKRNWLLYLVIFSLALNLGTIGTLVYLRYQGQQSAAARAALPPLPLRELWGQLQLDDTQRQALRNLFPEHRRQVQDLRGRLAQKRLELFDLIKGEAPSWEAVQAKVKEISALQGNLEEEMARFLLEFKNHLKPGQDAAFLEMVQTRLGRALGPWGPMGPHHGPRREGMGPPPPGGFGGPDGPGGPGCPPGPGCPD
jgi:Spy/CpxP family protein refolding chaperone